MKPLPGHAEDIIGKGGFDSPLPVLWDCLYRTMNSLQDSIRVKSLLQLVSNIAFTPRDLNKVVSFLKTWHKKCKLVFISTKSKCFAILVVVFFTLLKSIKYHGPAPLKKRHFTKKKRWKYELQQSYQVRRYTAKSETTNMKIPKPTWSEESPYWTAREALDWGDTETITVLPFSKLERNSSKLCFSSMTVSADVMHPLQSGIKLSCSSLLNLL